MRNGDGGGDAGAGANGGKGACCAGAVEKTKTLLVLKENTKTLLCVVLMMVLNVEVMMVLLLAALHPSLFVRASHHTNAEFLDRYMLYYLWQCVFRLLLQSDCLPYLEQHCTQQGLVQRYAVLGLPQ